VINGQTAKKNPAFGPGSRFSVLQGKSPAERKTKMYIDLKLFVVEVKIHPVRWWFSVSSLLGPNQPEPQTSVDFCKTYRGARFKAWRLARCYADQTKVDQLIRVWSEFEDKEKQSLEYSGVIEAKTKAAFFGKRIH
jgi:hypothetical protein